MLTKLFVMKRCAADSSFEGYRKVTSSEVLAVGPQARAWRVDVDTGDTVLHDHGPGRFGAEPLPVPKVGSTDEGDCWVLVCVNDEGGGPAELVVLDGEDLAADPVARVHLPRRGPDGFHGQWVPDASVAP